MIHKPTRYIVALMLFATLAALAIVAVFRIINAPIERDIARMEADMATAQLTADATHEALMAEQRAQLEARYDGFTPLDVPLSEWHQREIYAMCEEVFIPFEVVMSLIKIESDFDPNAVSDTDDHGLCQINWCNLSWLREEENITDIYDPLQNVRACLLILGPLWAKHGPHRALMAYQYGEAGAARKWAAGQVTSWHSRKVLAQAAIYGWEVPPDVV